MNLNKDVWIICFFLYNIKTCNTKKYNYPFEETDIECDLNEAQVMQCNTTRIIKDKPDSIGIHYWPVDETTIPTALTKLNIKEVTIKRLLIYPEIPKSINWTVFLNFSSLEIVEICFPEYKYYKIQEHFTDLPTSVNNFTINNAIVPPISELSNLSYVTFNDGESTSTFGNCEHLKRLELSKWKVTLSKGNISKAWLSNCSQLREMKLTSVSVETIKEVLTGLKSLTHLSIENCNVLTLTKEFLTDSTGLKSFVFKYNQVTNLNSDAFENIAQIEYLDLTGNFLYNTSEVKQALTPLTKLRSLYFDKNRELCNCELFSELSFLPLEHLSLKFTRWTKLCFKRFDKLRTLDLQHNRISKLDLKHLPTPNHQTIVVDLRQNTICNIYGSKEEFEDVTRKYSKVDNVTILVNNLAIDCDCNHDWVAKAFHLLPNLHIDDEIRCSNGTAIIKTPPSTFECDKFICDTCTCRRSWVDNTTSVDCKKNTLTAVPTVERLRELYVYHNRIERLYVEDFPETLKFADLSNNRISSIKDDVVEAMFGCPDLKLLLAENPLVCGCDTRSLVVAIHEHKDQVLDFENITCANDGQKIQDIDIYNFCVEPYNPSNVIIVILALLMLVTVIIAILFKRYKYQIELYLFSKGFSISFIKEELDFREFDAFISFCHMDEEFITTNILPELRNFKLCIHYRDWIAGEWIPKQIAKSIELSKRTILVLSNNYLDSLWGMLEFRMAHAATLTEGRRRLVAIIVDDIFDNPHIDAEMRGYLASNTYIKWDDPWFSEKLRFSLPRHDQNETANDLGIDIDRFKAAVVSYRSSNSHAAIENNIHITTL